MSWIRPRDHNLFVNLGSLVLCGLLAGVVVAAAFFPSVAMSGLLAKESLEQFDQLPTELTVREGSQISYLYASNSTTLLTAMYDEHRRNIPLDEMGDTMTSAIIAAEDKNFYEHNGVDTRGIVRAFVANAAADQVTQGASTITQQFVRLSLTYFSSDFQDVVEATEETTARKLREVRMAIAVEKQMSKDEILERYLNLAYFGEGAYGIFAASQVYFGKPPAELEVHEAALLAGMVQAPSDFNPSDDSDGLAIARRNWVIDQMVITEAITPAEAAEAKAIPLDVEPERPRNMCVGVVKNHWGFFCDYFHRWWLEQEQFGATPWEREQRLRSGGYHIVTSLDTKVQKSAKEHVEEQLPTSRSQPHALMVAAVEPGTGYVRAMATNRNFRLDDPEDPKNGPHSDPRLRDQGLRGSYPNTVNPLISGGGDIDGYQAGSTFKLFTMIAALEEGLALNTSIYSPNRVPTSFIGEIGAPTTCNGNKWCPVNHPGQTAGSHNMWTGFGQSINTYFAQLVDRVGADKAVDVAKRAGIQFRSASDAQFANEGASTWGPFTLGVSATTPLDLAVAYATISAEGFHCEPLPVVEIRTPDGDSLDLAEPRCKRVFDKDVARAAIDAGRCVTGTGSRLGGCGAGRGTVPEARGGVGKPVWGKTGTSDGSRTYTTVLSTKQLTVAGQIADPDWAQTTAQMESYRVRGAVVPILRDAMADRESQDWATPTDEDLIRGPEVNIPDVRCLSVGDAESRLRGQGFNTRVDDQQVDSDCAPGQVARTTPSGVTSPGDTITIHVSNGAGFRPTPSNGGGDGDDGDDDNGNGNGNGNGGPGNGGGGGGGGGPPPPDDGDGLLCLPGFCQDD